MKTETWNGYEIRFIEKEPGEWWAVAVDVAKALYYPRVDSMIRKLKPYQKDTHKVSTLGGEQELSVISEQGLYKVIMRSNKAEAQEFEEWVFQVLKTLRQSTGLEGFQVFRMLDKEHQKQAIAHLYNHLAEPGKRDFIKANTVANKAVSSMFGLPKMIGKDDMSPEMLAQRQPILDDTVQLMAMQAQYGLDFSISKAVYRKYLKKLA